jgi:hypothetical protein
VWRKSYFLHTERGIKKMEEKAIHIRIDLYPGKPGYKKFCEIKTEKGVHNNIEVLRTLISGYRLKRRPSNE